MGHPLDSQTPFRRDGGDFGWKQPVSAHLAAPALARDLSAPSESGVGRPACPSPGRSRVSPPHRRGPALPSPARWSRGGGGGHPEAPFVPWSTSPRRLSASAAEPGVTAQPWLRPSCRAGLGDASPVSPPVKATARRSPQVSRDPTAILSFYGGEPPSPGPPPHPPCAAHRALPLQSHGGLLAPPPKHRQAARWGWRVGGAVSPWGTHAWHCRAACGGREPVPCRGAGWGPGGARRLPPAPRHGPRRGLTASNSAWSSSGRSLVS